MQITHAEVRPCPQAMRDASWKFARAALPRLDGHVLVLTDEVGTQGLGYVHAIPAITGPGAANRAATEWLAALLVGRPYGDLAPLIDDLDARLAMNPAAKAAVDMALHDLLARRLGVPLHTLLGGARRHAIALSRIVPIKAPAEMGAAALALATQGYRTLKLKLSGESALDAERVASVRDAVGPGIVLTLDPNQSYSAKQMMASFGRIERHGIALIEQPVPAADWDGLALLTRTLPVAIEADESAQTVYDVQRLVAARVVDVVNLKITKLGGLRRFQQAVQLCEAGGVVARVGAAFGPALLQAFAAHAASSIGALPQACELAEHLQLLDDPFTPMAVAEGVATLPGGPGCGVVFADPPTTGAG